MMWLSALLPVATGVGAYASLDRDARAQVAGGDGRTVDQLRADLLVDRIAGRTDTQPAPVELHLTMHAKTLLADDPTPVVVGRPRPHPTGRGGRSRRSRQSRYPPTPSAPPTRSATASAQSPSRWRTVTVP